MQIIPHKLKQNCSLLISIRGSSPKSLHNFLDLSNLYDLRYMSKTQDVVYKKPVDVVYYSGIIGTYDF